MKTQCGREKASGFTLIEVLVAMVIISVTLTVLYTSFQSGLAAFRRTEETLSDRREGDVFRFQLERELKNMIPYLNEPFVGGGNSIVFPARLTRYSPNGIEEEMVVIEYEYVGRSLIRKERKMKRKLSESKETRETLFEKVDTCRFEFLYADEVEGIHWASEWVNEPYVGLPRGVRVTLSGEAFGESAVVYDFLIPHGVLLQGVS